MTRFGALMLACVLATGFQGPSLAETGDGALEPVTISHVSGKPVPRFETLRFAAVNGRTGPSQDHPIAWRYERLGLPVLILKETHGWRYVRDPDGDEVWMHERMLGDAGTVMALEQVTVLSAPRAAATPKAEAEVGALLSLGRCEAGFCHVSSGRHGGWAPMGVLWGAGLNAAAES